MAPDTRSDHELLRVAHRDPEAFGVFYDRHGEALLAFLYRRTGCAATAADLAAEVFAAAFAKRTTFRQTEAPARAWLYGIARRQLGSFLRRRSVADRYRRRFGISELTHTDDQLSRVEALVDLAPVAESLHQALGSLPEGQQRALWMRIVDRRSYRDIAGELGCTEGAARVRVSRGLTRLADLMEAP